MTGPGLPPRPVLAFRVGVTGSRKLAALTEAARAAVEERVGTVLDAVTAMVDTIVRDQRARSLYHTEHGQVIARLRVLSPLAEGADRLVAQAGRDRGYELDIALPFPPDDYAADFKAPDSKAAFAEFLGRPVAAEALPHLALDGGRGDEENASYEAIGHLVVRNCDLLIAIWDGKPAAGRGGTGDIVRFATGFGRPVWWISTDSDVPPRLLLGPEDLRPETPPIAASRTALERVFAVLLLPPEQLEAKRAEPHEAKRGDRHGQKSIISGLAHGLHRHGRRLPGGPGRLVHWLLAPSEAPLDAYLRERPQPQRWIWRLYAWGYRAIGGPRRLSAPHADIPEGPARYWDAFYQPADRGSMDYGDRYRSSYLWIFALATLAVTCAVASLAREGLKPAATFVEFLLLVAILWTVVVNERHRWHQRWIAYRLLAELCRKQGALAVLGWSLPPPDLRRSLPPDANPDEPPPPEAWVGWYFNAALRAAPLPAGTFDAPRLEEARRYVCAALVEEQRIYHEDRHDRSRSAGLWLFNAGEYTFLGTMTLVFLKLVLLPFSGHDAHGRPDGFHDVIVVLGVLAAILPAASAAFVGIRAYAELELLESQSRRMERVMSMALERIDLLRFDRPLASQDLAADVSGVSAEMLHEVGGWAELFRVKAVEPG